VGFALKAIYFAFSLVYIDYASIDILKRNDSFWYEKIAVNGHEKITPEELGKCDEDNIEQSYYAFFPLYPIVIGGSMWITGLGFDGVAFFYSIFLMLCLSILMYWYAFIFSNRNSKIAFYSALILLIFPFHYYFSVFYTESLFLVILLGLLISIEYKSLSGLLILSSMLVLVRPNGLFTLVPVGLYYLEKRTNSFSIGDLIKTIKFKDILKLKVFAVPVIVFAGYCLYLYFMTGDFFAYKTAQVGWCRETVMPWIPFMEAKDGFDYFRIVYFIFFVGILFFSIRKIPFSLFVFIGMNLAIPLVANSIPSPRFISVLFVFSILFALKIEKLPRPLIATIFAVMLIGQLWSFSYWLDSSPFSY